MKKRSLLLGMLVIVLAFGMSVVGCDDSGGGGGSDDWGPVTSLSQVNGTWKGSQTQTDSQGGITQKVVIEVTYVINATAKTMAMTQKSTMTASGSNVNSYWEYIKGNFEAGTVTETDDDGNTYTVKTTINDSTHTITIEMTEGARPISDDDFAEMSSQIEISKNGKKIRQLISGEDEDKEYVILNKQ